MASLAIPESGILLDTFREPSSKHGPAVPDVFGISLTDGMIEEMIKCVQNGKSIQLSLGEHPSILYGTKTQHFSISDDSYTHELYASNSETPFGKMPTPGLQSNTKKGTVKAPPKSHTSILATFTTKKLNPSKTPPKTTTSAKSTSNKADSSTAGTDAALAQLQNSLASENLKKQENTIKFVKDGSLSAPGRRGVPTKGTNKSKFLGNKSIGGDTSRSMPSSPALSGTGSPSLGPTSVPLSQQTLEKAKAMRRPIIHLLAVGPCSKKELREKVDDGSNQDFENALQKVGDLNETTRKYELRKNSYKELDVWTFKYEKTEDRQLAIDNAVKQYDKMRLGVSEPEWDRLLIKSERGSGKCLSKLQARIAEGTARPPKINVEKAESSGRDTPISKEEENPSDKNLSKVKGEGMSRSASQVPSTKPKKVGEKEAQAKRLLSKNTHKVAPAPASKPAQSKKAPQAKAGSKVLSSEFVQDSDEEDDYAINHQPAPTKCVKRSREEDDIETSDSSVPLSKKVKKDTLASHRISDASQTSRATNTSHHSSNVSTKKDTSPQKSSPLASSPPTNASEVDHSSSNGGRTSSSTSPVHKTVRSPIHKRHQKSSSVASSSSSSSSTSRYLRPEVVDKARKFKVYYQKYELLYRELTEVREGRERDKVKEKSLMQMHYRLADMKKEIMDGIVDVDQN